MQQLHKEKEPVHFREKAMRLLESGKWSVKRMLMPKKRRERLDGAFIYAARNGENEDLRRLIKAGADVTVKDMIGRTALHFAVEERNIELCKLIIDKCAKADRDIREFITAKSRQGGHTALHDAAFNGSTEICALLIREYAEAGGDVKELITVKNRDGLTPLQWSAWNGPTKACKLLIEEYTKAGGDPKELIAAKDEDKRTPLHEAARTGCTQLCGMLMQKYMEAGGSINELTAGDKDGKTPIRLAMEGGYDKTAQLIAVELLKATVGNETFGPFMASFSECISGGA